MQSAYNLILTQPVKLILVWIAHEINKIRIKNATGSTPVSKKTEINIRIS